MGAAGAQLCVIGSLPRIYDHAAPYGYVRAITVAIFKRNGSDLMGTAGPQICVNRLTSTNLRSCGAMTQTYGRSESLRLKIVMVIALT